MASGDLAVNNTSSLKPTENNPPKNTHSCMDYLEKTTAAAFNTFPPGIVLNGIFGAALGGWKGLKFAMEITNADVDNNSILKKVAAIFTAVITMPAGIALGMAVTPFMGVKEGWDNKFLMGGLATFDRYVNPKTYWSNTDTYKKNSYVEEDEYYKKKRLYMDSGELAQ